MFSLMKLGLRFLAYWTGIFTLICSVIVMGCLAFEVGAAVGMKGKSIFRRKRKDA